MRQPNVIYITIRPAHNYLGNLPIWGYFRDRTIQQKLPRKESGPRMTKRHSPDKRND